MDLATQAQLKNQINNILQTANNTLNCPPGTQCYKDNQKRKLESKLNEARNNAREAPIALKNAEKDVMEFTLGSAKYNEYMRERLKNNANSEKMKLIDEHNQLIKEMKNDIQIIIDQNIYIKNMNDLLSQTENTNEDLKKQIADKTAVLNTTERKIYYENKEINKLNSIYNWVKLIFYLVVITWLFVIIYDKRFTITNGILFIIICLYYYFLERIIGYITNFISFLSFYINRHII